MKREIIKAVFWTAFAIGLIGSIVFQGLQLKVLSIQTSEMYRYMAQKFGPAQVTPAELEIAHKYFKTDEGKAWVTKHEDGATTK